MKRLLFLPLVLLATPATARDARIVTRTYNPDQVVLVPGKAGVQATIALAEDEHIENVAIGDATRWQVTPNRRANLLFVKPLNPTARTNMTVVTDRHTYLFDLVAGTRGTPLYVLRFTYAKDDHPAPALAAITAEEAQAAAQPPPEAPSPPPDPASFNFAWKSRGSAHLLPQRIYDDGSATYLAWPLGGTIPAILTRNEQGEEGPINYAVRGEVIVLPEVPRLIVLRAGKDSATLENAASAPKLAEGH